MKELLMKTLFAFNLLDLETRKYTYKNILRNIDVFNAVFSNIQATLNTSTLTVDFYTIT